MSLWQNPNNSDTSYIHHKLLLPYTGPIAVFVSGNSSNIQIATAISEQIEVTFNFNSVNASQQLTETQSEFSYEHQRLTVIAHENQWPVHTSIDISIKAPAFTTIDAFTATGNITINTPNCTAIHASTPAGNLTITAPNCPTIHTSTSADNLTINAPAASIQYHTVAEIIAMQPALTQVQMINITPSDIAVAAPSTIPQEIAQPLTNHVAANDTAITQIPSQTLLQRITHQHAIYVAQVHNFLQRTVTVIKEASAHFVFLHQIATNITQASAHFFADDHQEPIVGTTGKPSTEFTIMHLFSIMVVTCAAFVYPMAFYRSDMSEVGDQYLVMAALCTAAATFGLLQFAPQLFHKISTHIGAKILLVLMVLAFLGFGFREDDFYTEFVGLGPVIFGCLLAVAFGITTLRSTVATNALQFGMKTLSIFVLVMGLNAVLIDVSLTDNFYVINEMVTSLTNLHSYSTFIPQYVNLYQYFPRLLDMMGITKYPQLSLHIIYVFLQFISIITIGIAVYLNYYFMHRRSLFMAILFTVPLFFISSRPFWDYERPYYVLQLFVYSLVPNRIFAVFSVGAICIWLLRKANKNLFNTMLYGCICGIIASIGVYQNNDFGLFAAIGVGAAIIFQPFQAWIKRIALATVFVVSTLIGLSVLLVTNTDWATLNSDYLFWFQRAFSTGSGSELIKFPGNGLMVIISVFVMWFCTLKLYITLRRFATIYDKDPLTAGHFATLMFVATTSVLGLSYYINHSVISFQGSSMYICWGISMFLLYQLTQRMTAQQPHQYQLRYSNLAFQLLVLLPVAIALIYTPLSSRLNQDSMAIKKIFTTDPNDMTNTPAYNELHIQHINDVYTALQPIQADVAFVGAFANLVQLYTHIPAASIFDHPANVTFGEPALRIYCNQMDKMQYDIYITDQPYTCENKNLIISDKLGIFLYLNKSYQQTHPQQWQQLRDIANICLVDPSNGATVCPNP